MLRKSSGTNSVTNAITCRSGFSALELLPHLRLAVGRGLVDRQPGGERGLLQRIGLLARLLRRHIDADDVLAALEQRLEHRLAEGLLAVNDDAHVPRSHQPPPPFSGAVIAPDALISGDFLVGVAEHLGQHLLVVLAEQRRTLHAR